jgi:hypothetical protein
LKLEVMGYTMCSDGGFSWYYFGKHDYDADFPKAQLPQEFVFLLMSIPEIKPLVVEAFYSRNTFVLQGDGDVFYSPKDKVILPPRSLRKHIRYLEVRCNTRSPDFASLAEIADSSLGFGKMKSVRIEIQGSWIYDKLPSLEAVQKDVTIANTVIFDTSLLEITYHHIWGGDAFTDPTEMPMMDKFGLKHVSDQGEESLVRYYGRSGRDTVDAWPFGPDTSASVRITRKTMSA